MVVETFVAGDVRMRVLTLGSGAPLLYLHGYERHPGEAPYLTRLAETHRVIAPELPGYGESTGLDEIHDVLDMVMILRQLVEKLADGPVDVVGHSLGGMLAAEFAAICPHLTRKLVLVDSYGIWLDANQLPDAFVLNDKQLKAAKWANPDAAGAVETSWSDDLVEDPNTAALARMQNLGSATKFMWPIPDRGLKKRLNLITAPTLVLHGAKDGLIPAAYATEMASRIPGAKATIFEGAGHLPMIECADEFIAAVNAHLA